MRRYFPGKFKSLKNDAVNGILTSLVALCACTSNGPDTLILYERVTLVPLDKTRKLFEEREYLKAAEIGKIDDSATPNEINYTVGLALLFQAGVEEGPQRQALCSNGWSKIQEAATKGYEPAVALLGFSAYHGGWGRPKNQMEYKRWVEFFHANQLQNPTSTSKPWKTLGKPSWGGFR
jgi:hypothetical protein